VTDVTVDVALLRSEIEKTYTQVSTEPGKDFIFPTGRPWAEDLGYPQPELSNVPEATVESFAGVANPFVLGRIEGGADVLDLGCGAGTDLLIAAQMVGPRGSVTGVDMTPSMLERARASAAEMGIANVELHQSLIETLPLEDESVDPCIHCGAGIPTGPDRAPRGVVEATPTIRDAVRQAGVRSASSRPPRVTAVGPARTSNARLVSPVRFGLPATAANSSEFA